MNPVKNERLNNWVGEMAALCQPDTVHWCDGSKEEYDRLMAQMVKIGMAFPLKKRPKSFLFRSDPSDVARVEARTYISTPTEGQAGPTNNWINDAELKQTMRSLYNGCMKGRTMYVIPFSMGAIGSPMAKIGVEITDSPYVVCNMHIMTRLGTKDPEFENAIDAMTRSMMNKLVHPYLALLRDSRDPEVFEALKKLFQFEEDDENNVDSGDTGV